MNKKMIKTVLLLLLIPVIICIIISVINLNKNNNQSFSSSTSYETSSNTGYQYITTHDSELGDGQLVSNFNKNYTILFATSIVLLIGFIIFYIFLNRKKEW